jgi:hypothetical protein
VFYLVSVALTECACGCAKDSISPAPQSEVERRDSPPPSSHRFEFGDLEAAQDKTPEQRRSLAVADDSRYPERMKRRQMLKDCNLPSGLSVEEDDGSELETTVF